MEYTSMFEPLIIILLSLLGGMLIGCVSTFYLVVKERREMMKELDAKTDELNRYTMDNKKN